MVMLWLGDPTGYELTGEHFENIIKLTSVFTEWLDSNFKYTPIDLTKASKDV